MQTINLHITGMTCNGCANSIQRVLGELSGVENVAVDWQNGSAVIQFSPNIIQTNDLIEAIENAGFDVQAA